MVSAYALSRNHGQPPIVAIAQTILADPI